VEVPASHVSFVSQPEAATQLILQAVGHCCIRGDRVWQRDCWYENPPPSPCSRYAV
jgi:hypothetical protein